MKAFIMHLCADDLEDVPWIEAVGSLLGGQTSETLERRGLRKVRGCRI